MASAYSILKSVLNLNNNRIKICDYNVVETKISRFKESYLRKEIMVDAVPYKQEQKRCPICGRKCPGYDTKRNTDSRW